MCTYLLYLQVQRDEIKRKEITNIRRSFCSSLYREKEENKNNISGISVKGIDMKNPLIYFLVEGKFEVKMTLLECFHIKL